MHVRIYTLDNCKYCEMAKNFLRKKGVKFEEADIKENKESFKKIVEITGQMSVPIIEIEDEIFVGFHRSEIERALNK
ncbi:MAG: glutaredoxin family protein [Candidatus Paceibacterota bacterium]